MIKTKRATVAGHICLDVIPSLDHLPAGQFTTLFQPGQLVSLGTATFATGGPVSNTGLALHRLGIPTRLIAKVGEDIFGKVIRNLVSEYDPLLNEGILTDQAAPTSYTVIISPPGVDRLFLHCPGANDTFCSDDIDYDLVAQSHLFHFGYPPIMRRVVEAGGVELVSIFHRAKATGATTSLDLAFPDPSSEGGRADWRHILGDTLPYVDIFTPSFEELLFLLHRETYEQLKADGINQAATPQLLTNLSDELLAMGAKIVLLKLGDRGAYLRTAGAGALAELGRAKPEDLPAWMDQALWAPCFQVEVVGTTGAGDATIAGFLSALLRELRPREALVLAVAVGACNVEAADALSGLCGWHETLQRIERGWERCPLDLSEYAWRLDVGTGIWSAPKA